MIKQLALLLLAAATLAPSAGHSHSHKRKNLEIVHPWTFETREEGVTTARVYMTVKNSGRAADRLLSASTPAAEKVELAAGGAEAGAGSGKSAARFRVEAGKVLALHPGGPHLLLTGVKKAFHAYGDFKMILVFEKAGRVAIDVVVEEEDEDPQR